MSIRKLVILPDPLLRKVSDPVRAVDKEMRALVDDMFKTMYDAPGIGLAAVQVGKPIRLFTLDVGRKTGVEKNPMVFINPEIVWRSEDVSTHEEGCLSIPDYYTDVERPARIRVKYQDMDGKAHELEADGILSTCIQHEFDHLNGVLFIDHISKLRKMMVMKKFTKAARLREAGI